MKLYVKRNDNGEIAEVRKYIIDSDKQQSIWSNAWCGRHIIGVDCEWDLKKILASDEAQEVKTNENKRKQCKHQSCLAENCPYVANDDIICFACS